MTYRMIDNLERRTRVPGICPPWIVIAPVGDVLVKTPYLLIGGVMGSIEASPMLRAHGSFRMILGVGVLMSRSYS